MDKAKRALLGLLKLMRRTAKGEDAAGIERLEQAIRNVK